MFVYNITETFIPEKSFFFSPSHNPSRSHLSVITSGFQKTTPLSQSSCFSSNASPPPARTARGSDRPLAWACSSGGRRCSRYGRGTAACTSQSMCKEDQSRERSVENDRVCLCPDHINKHYCICWRNIRGCCSRDRFCSPCLHPKLHVNISLQTPPHSLICAVVTLVLAHVISYL